MGLVFLLALGALLFYLSATIGTAWFLTHPPRRTLAWALAKARPADPAQLPVAREFRDWTLNAQGRALRIWEIVGDWPEGPTVVLTHGWGDSRMGALSRVPLAAARASRVIAWDLAGHGDSAGWCALGTCETGDLLMLLDQLPPGDVVLWGWSLGAGVSIAAAARLVDQPGSMHVCGLICESGYREAGTPAGNVLLARGLPWRVNLPAALWCLGAWLGVGPGWRGFDRAGLAARLQGRVPLLVVHGASDIVCPLQDGEAICDAAHGETCVINGAGHNDLWTNAESRRACEAHIGAFLTRVGQRASRPDAASRLRS